MTSSFDTFPDNVPRELITLFRENKCNIRAIERIRKVNRYYVYQLLKHGKEPSDKRKKGRAARVALFLPEYRKRKVSDMPEEVRIWRGLPTEVRQRAIKEFVNWYVKGGKEKLNERRNSTTGS